MELRDQHIPELYSFQWQDGPFGVSEGVQPDRMNKPLDKPSKKVYEIDNVDFLLAYQAKEQWTGKIILEINQGGVARTEKLEVLK